MRLLVGGAVQCLSYSYSYKTTKPLL